jgi:hypothetical protein
MPSPVTIAHTTAKFVDASGDNMMIKDRRGVVDIKIIVLNAFNYAT